jgi:hypothetical protein
VRYASFAEVETVHDHCLAQPVGVLQQLFELGPHALRDDDGGPHDPLQLRLLEQPRHACLRDVQPPRDLGLEHVVLVVEPRDLDHQALLLDTATGRCAGSGRLRRGHREILRPRPQRSRVLQGKSAISIATRYLEVDGL